MGTEIVKIKSRIRSVTGAYKVTSAMKLVSTVKLKTYRNKMLVNRAYSEAIRNSASDVFNALDGVSSPLLNGNNSNKKLYVVISSSLGLCGSYNSNVFKLANSNISKNDELLVLGKKGITHFKNDSYEIIEDFSNYSSIKDETIIKNLTKYLVDKYIEGEYHEIHIIYTKYKNPIVFTPSDYMLLPLKSFEKFSNVGYPPLLEPSPSELFNQLAKFYIESSVYSLLLESEVCEQAARSNAMENATNNANELLDQLHIEFNKARQGAITQEIIEIVGAAEAL